MKTRHWPRVLNWKMASALAPLASLLAILLMPMKSHVGAVPIGFDERNAEIRSAFLQLPSQLGKKNQWLEIGTVAIPTSQARMLDLNAYVSKKFRRLASPRLIEVTLFLSHCADARTMIGHHPPNCYPAIGWDLKADATRDFEIVHSTGRIIRAKMYQFRIERSNMEMTLHVANGFVVAGERFNSTLEEASVDLGGDGMVRYGISQFQLVFQGQFSEDELVLYTDEIMSTIPSTILDATSRAPLYASDRTQGVAQ